MKTEPEVFSFSDLMKASGKTTCWEGVRNYQARNFMRDNFKLGDRVFVYHSNAGDGTGIAGIAEIAREAYPDQSALDPKSEYFDDKSVKVGASRWLMVDVKAVKQFKHTISLSALRGVKGLEGMAVLQKGQRLSVQPVSESEWAIVLKLAVV